MKLKLEDFEPELTIIRDSGFNPVALNYFLNDKQFVFETQEECTAAMLQLDKFCRPDNQLDVQWDFVGGLTNLDERNIIWLNKSITL